jgi:phosphotransferase system HPr-like phosphotransfer protein
MTSVKVSLNSIDKVKTFVNVINTFDGDFDLASDRYVIDAKSIMGIFSLDITNPLRLDIHNDAEVDAVKSALADYLVG